MKRLTGAALLFALGSVACSAEQAGRAGTSSEPLSTPAVFEFGTTQGGSISSATTRGRVTAILFVTTFDMASQLMARRLNEVARRFKPRMNAAAVALEAPNHAPLVEVFRQSLDLTYPVGMPNGDPASEAGPFGTIAGVPTLIVLDRSGRERSRHSGVMTSEELERALRAAER